MLSTPGDMIMNIFVFHKKNVWNNSGTLHWLWRYMKLPIKYVLMSSNFIMLCQLLISNMIFVAYELNLPLNMEKPHYGSQPAGEWSLIWAHDSRPIYRALTYIAVPLLGPHQPRYIGLTLYWSLALSRQIIRLKCFFYWQSSAAPASISMDK